MSIAISLVLSLLPVFIVAQSRNPGPSPLTSAASSVPSAPPDSPGHINVYVVFQGSFRFRPANFTAPNSTQVTFWFPESNLDHSVTQSSFEEPCTYLAATANNPAGFDSGLQHAATFNITITDDTKPIWFHCKQVAHCGMGMVGSINAPPTGNNYDAFLQAALKIGPSGVTEIDNGPVTGGVNGIATAPPAPTNNNPSYNILRGSRGRGGGGGGSNSASRSNSNYLNNVLFTFLVVALLWYY